MKVDLYFVERLQTNELAPTSTSLLLKALDLASRCRFTFLEESCEFSIRKIRDTYSSQLPDVARRLIRALDLLKRESQEAGLDKPSVWINFVESPGVLTDFIETWHPLEVEIRRKSQEIVAYEGEINVLLRLRSEFETVIEKLGEEMRPIIQRLIDQMSTKLVDLIRAGNK